MSLVERLQRLFGGWREEPSHESRRVRRARARERARETGEDPWPASERLDEQAPNEIPTITPGTPGNNSVIR